MSKYKTILVLEEEAINSIIHSHVSKMDVVKALVKYNKARGCCCAVSFRMEDHSVCCDVCVKVEDDK